MAKAPEGFPAFLMQLVRTVLFPLAFLQALNVARRHTDEDPRGPMKVSMAILIGLVLAVAGIGGLMSWREGAVDGMYESLEQRLSIHVGNEEYKGFIENARAHGETLQTTVVNKLAEARAEGNESKEQLWLRIQENTAKYQQENLTLAEGLLPNHDLFRALENALAGRDAAADAQAKQLLATTTASYEQMDQTSNDFAIKDKAMADMDSVMAWILWPSVIGLLYAPLVFALGSILANTFETSETIGYKKYPSKSMGLFLILGGFGWPALIFSAWTLQDVEIRSQGGQIAL